MAIDNPLDQAEVILANEARQQSPVIGQLLKFGSIVSALSKAAAALKTGSPGEAAQNVAEALNKISNATGESRAEYLWSIAVSELKQLQDRFSQLSEKQQEFLGTDFPSLVLDADRKARQTRTQEKIRRLARILCNAAESDPPPRADGVEENLRLAMDIDDVDVIILREAVRVQRQLLDNPEVPRYVAAEAWERGSWRGLGLTDRDIDLSCLKLQSLGFLTLLGQPSSRNDLAPLINHYLLTARGLLFAEAIKQQAAATTS